MVGHRKQQERTGTAYHRQPGQPTGEDENTAGYGLPAVQRGYGNQGSESAVPGRKGADQVAETLRQCRRMGNRNSNNYNTCSCMENGV